MNRDDIIRMAREVGFVPHFTRPQDAIVRNGYAISGELKGYKAGMLDIERFAALVAAHEREACAKVCEDEAAEFRSQKEGCRDARYDWKEDAAMECSLAIRSRGEVKP